MTSTFFDWWHLKTIKKQENELLYFFFFDSLVFLFIFLVNSKINLKQLARYLLKQYNKPKKTNEGVNMAIGFVISGYWIGMGI